MEEVRAYMTLEPFLTISLTKKTSRVENTSETSTVTPTIAGLVRASTKYQQIVGRRHRGRLQ